MADIWVAHIHAGGCDACSRAWETAWAAVGPGWRAVSDPAEAALLAVTGVPNELGADALDRLLGAWAADGPGTLLLVGDCAINGGLWARLGAPGVQPGVASAALPPTIAVQTIPGDPPTPPAILDGLKAVLTAEH
jgi:Ni,Fe-hydrogenase III small subunit